VYCYVLLLSRVAGDKTPCKYIYFELYFEKLDSP